MTQGGDDAGTVIRIESPDDPRIAGYHAIRERDLVGREGRFIAEGKVVLSCPWGGVPGQLVAGDAPGDAEVLYGFSPRQITDDSTRGYA